jgi:hypothetical protein
MVITGTSDKVGMILKCVLNLARSDLQKHYCGTILWWEFCRYGNEISCSTEAKVFLIVWLAVALIRSQAVLFLLTVRYCSNFCSSGESPDTLTLFRLSERPEYWCTAVSRFQQLETNTVSNLQFRMINSESTEREVKNIKQKNKEESK